MLWSQRDGSFMYLQHILLYETRKNGCADISEFTGHRYQVAHFAVSLNSIDGMFPELYQNENPNENPNEP